MSEWVGVREAEHDAMVENWHTKKDRTHKWNEAYRWVLIKYYGPYAAAGLIGLYILYKLR